MRAMAPKARFGSSVGRSSASALLGVGLAEAATAGTAGAWVGAAATGASVAVMTAWAGAAMAGWPVSRRSWFSISCSCWLSRYETPSTAPAGASGASSGAWAGMLGMAGCRAVGAAVAGSWGVAAALSAAGAATAASAGRMPSRCWTTALGLGRSVISCRKLMGALKWRLICRASWVSSRESSPRSTKALSRSSGPTVIPQTSSMVSASS